MGTKSGLENWWMVTFFLEVKTLANLNELLSVYKWEQEDVPNPSTFQYFSTVSKMTLLSIADFLLQKP